MIRSAVWLILEAQFGLNDDYIECYGSLYLICESTYRMCSVCDRVNSDAGGCSD